MSEGALDLPMSWVYARLADLGDVQLGKMLDKKRTRGIALPYLRNANVQWGRIDTSDLLEMPFQPHEIERYSLRSGDVLVCEGGEPGRAAVWRAAKTEIKYQKALHRVRLRSGIEPEWIVHLLFLDAHAGRLSKRFTGTTIGHLPREVLVQYELPVAPAEEQHRIVQAIESYLSRLDEAEAALERVQRNLRRYRAAVLQAAVDGRLVPTEAELARREGRDYEPASELLKCILAERRRRWEEAELARLKAVGKAPKDDRLRAKYVQPQLHASAALPQLPAGWCWATADQLTERITDGEHVTPPRTTSGVLLLSARNVLAGRLALDEVDYVSEETHRILCRRLRVKAGDVLLSCSGSVGRSCIVPEGLEFSLVRSVAVLVPVLPIGSFLSLALQTPFLQKQIHDKKTETAQANIFQGKIKTLVIPLPPQVEQTRIITEAQRLLSLADATEVLATSATRRGQRLRQSILKWAFEGKLVDQDPNDEPASVLLERIRAERAAQDQPHSRRRARRTTETPRGSRQKAGRGST